MQKFVVKKSKSAPLATTSAKQPLQMTKTALLSPVNQQQIQMNDDKKQISPSNDNNKAAVTDAAVKTNAINTLSLDNNNLTACCRSSSNGMTKTTTTVTTQPTVTPIIKTNHHPARSSTSPSLVPSNVKMSGYLKKKRNKMGGWRKLWFVLQNQLLLSYSSKEDYERKLAPFKDVLNLVPGTIIRPTKGPRFTIETSTNLIYTFRCDNTNECSEWITALVESLGLNTGDSNKLANASNKLHFSMENLSKGNNNSRLTPTITSSSSSTTSPASSFMSSRSCDSIYRGPTIDIKPESIQQNPFRVSKSKQHQHQQHQSQQNEQNISKMTTMNKTENQLKLDDVKCNKITQSAQNFRLHLNAPENLQTKQSYEVYQINRMFNAASKGQMLESNGNGNENGIDIGRHGNGIVNGNEGQQQRKLSQRHHHHHHHHRHHHRDIVKEEQPYLLDNNFINNNLIVTMADKHIILANGNCCSDENMENIALETNDNKNENENDNNSGSMIIQRKKSAASSIISSSSSTVSTASTASASKRPLRCNARAMNGVINECPDDDNIDHDDENDEDDDDNDVLDGAIKNDSNDPNEPIYAVVNLKNKYENRARKWSPSNQLYTNYNPHKERPNSFHVISTNDYEEVLNGIEVIEIKDDENIYEPISIPELTTKGPLWRYFSKINIDTLIEAARWKKEQNVDNENTTTFADMRKRFGQHRKSLKNRMKKLYNRGGYDEQAHKPNEIDPHNGTTGASSSSFAEKIHHIDNNMKNGINDDSANKKDKHLFYSMLKKSRTSLSFDDAPRKRIIMAIGGGTVFKSKSSRNLEVKKL